MQIFAERLQQEVILLFICFGSLFVLDPTLFADTLSLLMTRVAGCLRILPSLYRAISHSTSAIGRERYV